MEQDRLYIVFGIDHYNPLGAIRSLGENGIKPVYIAIPGRAKIASSSCYISKTHWVKDYTEGCKLLLDEYGNCSRDSLPTVITTDDEQVNYMDVHYEDYKDKFIFFNAGEKGRITKYMDKYEILQMAKKHGLKTLPSWRVEKGQIPNEIVYPVITKSISPVVGGWKSDVFICENEEELKIAYEKIQAPTVMIQKFIEKKNELCIDGYSVDKGKKSFFAIASTYNYNIRGYYSPYMTVRSLDNPEISEKLNGLMEDIGFEGIYSIEFLYDQDGELFFSEVNFRNSTWSYGATIAGMPLPILWTKSMISKSLPELIHIDEAFTAMVEPIDYQKRVIDRGYDLNRWYKDFINSKCKYYYSEKDLKPFFEMLSNNNVLR